LAADFAHEGKTAGACFDPESSSEKNANRPKPSSQQLAIVESVNPFSSRAFFPLSDALLGPMTRQATAWRDI